MESYEIIELIGGKNKEIDSFYFFPLQKQWLLQDRIVLEEKDMTHINKALKIREELNLPFWDCVMLSTFDNPDFSEKILDAALCHRDCKDLIEIRNDETLRQNLFQLKEQGYAWNSLVKLKSGSKKHIPMLDFHIPVSDNNLIVVKTVLKKLGLTECLVLNSGESYHAVSTIYVNEENMMYILQKTLFFSPIIDRLWVAHQMLNKSCSLRIGKKHGLIPEVVALVNDEKEGR